MGKVFIRLLVSVFMPIEGLERRYKQIKITAICGIFASYLIPKLGIGLSYSLEPSLSLESRVTPMKQVGPAQTAESPGWCSLACTNLLLLLTETHSEKI